MAPVRSTPPSLQIIRRAGRLSVSEANLEPARARSTVFGAATRKRAPGRVGTSGESGARARDGVRSLRRGSLARRRVELLEISLASSRERHVPGDARVLLRDGRGGCGRGGEGPLLGARRVRPPARAAEARPGATPRARRLGARRDAAPGGPRARPRWWRRRSSSRSRTSSPRPWSVASPRCRWCSSEASRAAASPSRRFTTATSRRRAARRRPRPPAATRWDPPSSRAEALFGPRGCGPVLRPRRRGSVAFSLAYVSLTYLTVADSVAIFFLNPIFSSLLAWPVLGEPVGVVEAAAIALGLLGTTLIVKPPARRLERVFAAGAPTNPRPPPPPPPHPP